MYRTELLSLILAVRCPTIPNLYQLRDYVILQCMACRDVACIPLLRVITITSLKN